MVDLYSLDFLLMVVLAVTYYRVADREERSGLIWAGFSVGLWYLTWWVLKWGTLASLGAQAVPFIALTAANIARSRRRSLLNAQIQDAIDGARKARAPEEEDK